MEGERRGDRATSTARREIVAQRGVVLGKEELVVDREIGVPVEHLLDEVGECGCPRKSLCAA
jgi:hypothetical protein